MTVRRLYCLGLRGFMAAYSLALAIAVFAGRRQRPVPAAGWRILLTGTFYSDNWVLSHLKPLAMSRQVAEVLLVTTYPVPPIEHVTVIRPPSWAVRLLGGTGARYAVFVLQALRRRPDMVGGFHLLLNGLLALLTARVVGARALYNCGGGPREVLGGGYATENRLFNRIGGPDAILERQLIGVVGRFDLVVTRGKKAIEFFVEKGARTNFHVVPGGRPEDTCRADDTPKDFDLVFVGRLSAVKRLDLLLQAVKLVRCTFPEVRVLVVGDGPSRRELEAQCAELGLRGNVAFVGHQERVEDWLKRSRVFVLTSSSEGLSLAMIEAMLCGLPAVVSDVGDLGELVEDGINGYLVSEMTPDRFAECICRLLGAPAFLAACGEQARQAAARCGVRAVSARWDTILHVEREKGAAA